jgi:hypothetical protein
MHYHVARLAVLLRRCRHPPRLSDDDFPCPLLIPQSIYSAMAPSWTC